MERCQLGDGNYFSGCRLEGRQLGTKDFSWEENLLCKIARAEEGPKKLRKWLAFKSGSLVVAWLHDCVGCFYALQF